MNNHHGMLTGWGCSRMGVSRYLWVMVAADLRPFLGFLGRLTLGSLLLSLHENTLGSLRKGYTLCIGYPHVLEGLWSGLLRSR